MEGLKRGSAAIVGVAESDLGQVADGISVFDLMAQGTKRALDDCGLSLKDVDGLFSATTQSRLSVLGLAEYLGINPPFLGSTIVGGSSFEYHVAHAMGAIALGLCNVAVIAYGSTQRSVGRKQASVREVNPYETPFKPFLPSSAYALAASRHMHQFGTTREQLAAVAVAAREWALLNPAAWEKKPLTIDGVLVVPHGELSASRCATAASSPTAAAPSSSLRPSAPSRSRSRPPMCWAAASRPPTPTSPACRT